MQSFWKSVLRTDITKEQSKDAGMAFVFILLLLRLALKRDGFLYAALGLHVLNMIAPQVYRPAAVVWFTLSYLLGTVVSKVVLSILFFALVTPLGLLRRVFGKDSLQLKDFKAGGGSVMQDRNHTFTGEDIEQPY